MDSLSTSEHSHVFWEEALWLSALLLGLRHWLGFSHEEEKSRINTFVHTRDVIRGIYSDSLSLILVTICCVMTDLFWGFSEGDWLFVPVIFAISPFCHPVSGGETCVSAFGKASCSWLNAWHLSLFSVWEVESSNGALALLLTLSGTDRIFL